MLQGYTNIVTTQDSTTSPPILPTLPVFSLPPSIPLHSTASSSSMATLASQRQYPPPLLEVCCAGCGETLEVEPGLTEFVCPDCHTAQALPPELMPRKRRALPLPRGADSSKVQLPCGSCNTLLNVPHGLRRFNCPKCGVELGVDQDRLKGYLAGSSVPANEVAIATPSAVRLPLPAEIEPSPQINATTQSQRAPLFSLATQIEQNRMISSKSPLTLALDSEPHDLNRRASSSRGIVSPPINTKQNHNIPVSSSRMIVPCRVNTEQIEFEEEEENNQIRTARPETKEIKKTKRSRSRTTKETEQIEVEENNPIRTAPPEAKKIKKTKKSRSQPTKETEQIEVEEENDPIRTAPPEAKKIKKTKKSRSQPTKETKQIEAKAEENDPIRTAPPKAKRTKKSQTQITKVTESSLRRSRRIADSTPPSKKAEKQSQPSQNEVNDETSLEPLNIARHYNDLFPLDNELSMSDPIYPDPDPTIDSEDESDAGADQSESELEPENHEQETEVNMLEALRNAQQRRGLTPGSITKSKSRPGKRGPSKCLHIWDRPDDDPIEIEFNSIGQPIGSEAYSLSNFLGSIARDGKLVPLRYIDWRAVPVNYKDTIWFIVKSRFKVRVDNRRYVMKALGRCWSTWKSTLKKRHYDCHDNDEARLADIDERIERDQWPFLVRFWNSEVGQKRAANNKACAAKQKTFHTMGRKSFARLREEERLKRPDKEEPSRAEMFILTHTRKDGTPTSEESAEIIARLKEEMAKADASTSSNKKALKDDVLSRVLGREKGSHIRTYGLVPNRPGLWESRESEEQALVVSEARRLADEETKSMKEKMEEMERRHEEMKLEMELMQKTMLAMQEFVKENFGSGFVLPSFGQGSDMLRTPDGPAATVGWHADGSDRDTSS